MKLILYSLLLLPTVLFSQRLKPGFDKAEYIELLKVSAQFGDSTYVRAFPAPQQFKMVYRSPVMGVENRWEVWATNQGIIALSIRGTTANSVSWLANFYAAMVPAKGELQLSDTETFAYEMASSPLAQ